MSSHSTDDDTELMVIATDGRSTDIYYFSDGLKRFYGTGGYWYESRVTADGTIFSADELAQCAEEDGHCVWRRSDTDTDPEFWLDWGTKTRTGGRGRPQGIESVEPVRSHRHTNVTLEEGCYADPKSIITDTILGGHSWIMGAGSEVTNSFLDNLSGVRNATVEDSHLVKTDVDEGTTVRKSTLVNVAVKKGETVEGVTPVNLSGDI